MRRFVWKVTFDQIDAFKSTHEEVARCFYNRTVLLTVHHTTARSGMMGRLADNVVVCERPRVALFYYDTYHKVNWY